MRSSAKEIAPEKISAMPKNSPASSASSTARASPTVPRARSWCGPRTYKYTDKPLFIKALSMVAGNGSGVIDPDYDYTTFWEIAECARDAYAQAGVTDPRNEIAMAEVHDCFTPTELVLMEDLQFADRGTAWKEVLAGAFNLDGRLPVNPDGGLKSFGHPVGASGLRMMFEAWLQMRGEAPAERRIPETGRKLALTHNLGGYPGEMVSFISILGNELG
ncbi:thiolase C-terminal domain-containing protein [Yinghuangia aomiensis]